MSLRASCVAVVCRLLGPVLAAVLAGPVRAPAAPDPEAGRPFVDSFSPRDYRGHQQVWAAAEDAAGCLYFGNLNKVLVYDGARWTHLAVPDSTFIRGLAIDADDTLWIGGVDELGFAKTDATGARVFVSLKSHLPAEVRAFGTLWGLAVTPRGVVFQSTTWLLRWEGDHFTTLRLAESPRWRLSAVGREAWVTDSQHGWFRVRDEAALALEPLPRPEACANDRLLGPAAVLPGAAPAALVLTDTHGLWRWDGHAFTPFPTAIDGDLARLQPYAFTRLADGRLAICSLQAGVWLLAADGRREAHLLESGGLLDNTAITALPTRDGHALWLGLGRGIARVDARPWLSWFQPADGLPRSKLFTAVRFRDALYAPSLGGGLLRLVPATATAPARWVPEPAAPTHLNGVNATADALLLAGTRGIFSWDGASPAPATPLPGAAPNSTALLPLGGEPPVWAALNSDDVRLYRRGADGTWQTPGPVPGLERVRNLVIAPDGAWWIGRTAGGVARATFPGGLAAPPVVTTFTAPTALPVGHGWTRFTADAAGPLLLCNQGLLRFDPATQRFQPVTDYGAALADGSTAVYASAFDGRAGLWLILRPPDSAEASDELRLAFGRAGRLTPLHLPHLARIDDPGHLLHEPAGGGRPAVLWIFGHSAVVRLDLDRWHAAPPAPPPRLRLRAATTGSGRALPLTGDWELPYADRSLRLLFAAPALGADPATRYESTLVTASGSETRVEAAAARDFSALAAGRYQVHLRARAPGGDWSAPLTLAFTVAPPWWFRPAALAGYAVGAVLAIVLAWQIRVRRLLRRQRELETAVATRTAELAARTDQLAAQNAELVRLRQIEFDEKLAARLAEHKARLEVLRYQLNPHFLFNSLTSICGQILAAPAAARTTVLRLADFCRLTLHRHGESEEPTLGEEVEMLRAYLDIEQTRLGELLVYSIDCDPTLNGLRLPPFLLLPLVENAVKYGVATSDDVVRIRLTFGRGPDGNVLIEVANSGRWIPPGTAERSVPSLGIGLENLRQRLAKYFPGRHEFTTEPAGGWVVVRLRLPET